MVQKSQPMGFRGRRAAITTPTRGKAEKASVYQVSPEGGPPVEEEQQATGPAE